MKVIILVGGLGTRLRSITNNIPKPMVPINNRPFLEILLDYLISQGVTEVILAVGYLKDTIINHFSYKYKSLKINYSIEHTQLGTGGAILQALTFVDNNENVFILNGDTFCKVNYKHLYDYHLSHKSNFSMVIKNISDSTRYSTVKINSQNKVTEFCNNDKCQNNNINCGIYLIRKSAITKYNLPKSFSFEKDLLQPYVSVLDILAYKTEEFFIDIGIPEDYNFFKQQNNIITSEYY